MMIKPKSLVLAVILLAAPFHANGSSEEIYRTLLLEKKDQKHFALLQSLLNDSTIVQSNRLECLFYQYPKALRESAAGKKMLAEIRRKKVYESQLACLAMEWGASAY